ncbi:unnamed protein product [Amoebophrya sp. A120]|nr:unnamed protein product [Amoebophrya sp. A120]|eukprot:GSA120T00010856001.1
MAPRRRAGQNTSCGLILMTKFSVFCSLVLRFAAATLVHVPYIGGPTWADALGAGPCRQNCSTGDAQPQQEENDKQVGKHQAATSEERTNPTAASGSKAASQQPVNEEDLKALHAFHQNRSFVLSQRSRPRRRVLWSGHSEPPSPPPPTEMEEAGGADPGKIAK